MAPRRTGSPGTEVGSTAGRARHSRGISAATRAASSRGAGLADRAAEHDEARVEDRRRPRRRRWRRGARGRRGTPARPALAGRGPGRPPRRPPRRRASRRRSRARRPGCAPRGRRPGPAARPCPGARSPPGAARRAPASSRSRPRRRRRPGAPGRRSPSARPRPVPSHTNAKSSSPAATPSARSAIAARFTSFSITTGVCSISRSASSTPSCQVGRFTASRGAPVRGSRTPGLPMHDGGQRGEADPGALAGAADGVADHAHRVVGPVGVHADVRHPAPGHVRDGGADQVLLHVQAGHVGA